MATFGRHGMQQVEVDCHQLVATVRPYARRQEEDALVHTIISQCQTYVAQRCVDPAHVKPEVRVCVCVCVCVPACVCVYVCVCV